MLALLLLTLLIRPQDCFGDLLKAHLREPCVCTYACASVYTERYTDVHIFINIGMYSYYYYFFQEKDCKPLCKPQHTHSSLSSRGCGRLSATRLSTRLQRRHPRRGQRTDPQALRDTGHTGPRPPAAPGAAVGQRGGAGGNANRSGPRRRRARRQDRRSAATCAPQAAPPALPAIPSRPRAPPTCPSSRQRALAVSAPFASHLPAAGRRGEPAASAMRRREAPGAEAAGARRHSSPPAPPGLAGEDLPPSLQRLPGPAGLGLEREEVDGHLY